ncbi:SPL family radical SAM protein [Paraliomyxa miuraensis]|uniref:SPL family radical SAM protein n=1 Tax=Paraliomyxa miuraensis TaxID=376150 RepID=UPI00224E23FA|nr:radical SAM protein [Paraliomyxa miuraensis]MCX4243645.1 radical SAM protein [Paraliomyxa miuraensis]
MDVHRHLRALLAPLVVGDEVLPGVELDGTSTELGLRLRLTAGEQRIWIDVTPVDRTPRWAARSQTLAIGYRDEGGRNVVDQRLGLALCQRIAAIIATNEDAVVGALRREAAQEAPLDARVREVTVPTALDAAGPTEAPYYTINPYVGCVIGCRFCYAQTNLGLMRQLMGLVEIPWGSWVEVRANLPQVLAEELARLPPRPIKFCPIVGDAYQAVEKKLRVTHGCLEAIRDSGRPWPTMILTRSALMNRDVELMASLPAPWAGVSLPTIDDAVREHFEPRASTIAQRLDLLRNLRRAGVKTIAVVQPIFAGPLEPLADTLAEHVDGVSWDVLRGEEGARADFDDPRFEATRSESWQRDRAIALLAMLEERGVEVWDSDLPPPRSSPGS